MKSLRIAASVSIFLLLSCTSTHNKEGKLLDASSLYCQDLRKDNPEHYLELCESVSSWEKRDPVSYRESRRGKGVIENAMDSIIETAIDSALGIEEDGIKGNNIYDC